MSNNRYCRICLQALNSEEDRYHADCCERLFGSQQPPDLPYRWDQINELAEKVVRSHITVPGVQPKLSLHLETETSNRRQRLTVVGMEGGYILKPLAKDYPEMPELEHLTMRMAACFGLDAAESGLIDLEDRPAYITRRMDRAGRRKLHMEDMCQLTDRLTEQKYRGSMEQVGKAVVRYCTNALYDALRLFELTLFCFLTGNADMHLKNFSLRYAPDGEIRLSPAYDLLPTALIIPADTEESALTINGKKRRLTAGDFTAFGRSMGLTVRQLENARTRAADALPDALSLIDHGFCRDEMKERYRIMIGRRAEQLEI